MRPAPHGRPWLSVLSCRLAGPGQAPSSQDAPGDSGPWETRQGTGHSDDRQWLW